jgi:D-proline reductase (dithiol) PrdB
VGLVQRAIEEAGISTITLSTIASFTASVGAPRVAAIEHPLGRAFGQPGDHEGQRQVLRATLEALAGIDRPGTVVDLPFEWPEPPSRTRWHPKEPPPIARLFRRKPWLFPKLLSGRIPSA